MADRIASVVGARPQFIKAAPVSAALRAAGVEEILIHTGQHYDPQLSEVFFRELRIPPPAVNLNVGSGSHAKQTAQMLLGLEEEFVRSRPQAVLVYGDTNSTIAAALAAVKLHIPVHHVEAGLRSFNREMPEEHNRVLTDHCSDHLYCPTDVAVKNLRNEGITRGVHRTGDTMMDALTSFGPAARESSRVLADLGLSPGEYVLATVHRPSNTDNPELLLRIVRALESLPMAVVFPVHPRTRARLAEYGIAAGGSIRFIDPVGYLDMLALESGAAVIATDSGGIQKEAYMLRVPCVTLRTETEWVETVEAGWNVIADPATADIAAGILNPPRAEWKPLYGEGNAAAQIAGIIREAA